VSGIGIVINPHARLNRRAHARAEQFSELVKGDGLVCETESLEEMAAVAREFRERDIDLLAVCGGDGSFFRTLSALVRVYGNHPLPRFLPLRAGSMNTICHSVGWRRGTPERVLVKAVAAYRAGRPLEVTERHLLCVDGEHYGFMVGAGSIVNFLRLYYGLPGRGPWAAAALLGRLALSALGRTALARSVTQRTEADIDCDDERVPHRQFTVIYASSIDEIGLGFKATYLATRKRGFFHLIAGPLQVRHALRGVHRLRKGWPLDLDVLYDNLAQHVRVEFSRPTEYMIDGDILGPVTSLDVVIGPRLTIIHR
jgi:diacylglycerol kinase (ATP)